MGKNGWFLIVWKFSFDRKYRGFTEVGFEVDFGLNGKLCVILKQFRMDGGGFREVRFGVRRVDGTHPQVFGKKWQKNNVKYPPCFNGYKVISWILYIFASCFCGMKWFRDMTISGQNKAVLWYNKLFIILTQLYAIKYYMRNGSAFWLKF